MTLMWKVDVHYKTLSVGQGNKSSVDVLGTYKCCLLCVTYCCHLISLGPLEAARSAMDPCFFSIHVFHA